MTVDNSNSKGKVLRLCECSRKLGTFFVAPLPRSRRPRCIRSRVNHSVLKEELMNRSIKRLMSVCSLAACLVMFFSSPSLGASLSPLSSSVLVPLPFTTAPEPPKQFQMLGGNTVSGPFTGTWTAPALAPWVGTFSATGPAPGGPTPGTTNYDFTALPNGDLPVGTFFRFGDTDFGSGSNEKFELTAFIGTTQVLTPWLDETIGIGGAGSGSGGIPAAVDLPMYSFVGGVYTIDGTSVPGNPGIGFNLPSNTAITNLEVVRFSSNANFNLAAPVPEPSSLVLLCCGAGCAAGTLLVRRAKRRGRRRKD